MKEVSEGEGRLSRGEKKIRIREGRLKIEDWGLGEAFRQRCGMFCSLVRDLGCRAQGAGGRSNGLLHLAEGIGATICINTPNLDFPPKFC